MKRFMLFLTCLLMMVGSVMAQSQRVTGTVTDAADGKPIQGARVFVNGTSIGTVTDARGMFQLNVPQQHKELTVTFIGMKTQKVPVASTVNVKLSPNEQMLDEAIEWCRRRGVEFYAVNKDYPEEDVSKNMYFSRKLKADYFIDDRNIGGLPDWGTIYRIINERKTFAEIMMERQGQTEKPYKPKKKHWWG